MAFEKIVFAMKTWKDKVSGNTPITAAELNRIEKGISDCAKQTNALGDSVSQFTNVRILYYSSNVNDSIVCYIRLKASDDKEYSISFLKDGIRLYNATDSVILWEIHS